MALRYSGIEADEGHGCSFLRLNPAGNASCGKTDVIRQYSSADPHSPNEDRQRLYLHLRSEPNSPAKKFCITPQAGVQST